MPARAALTSSAQRWATSTLAPCRSATSTGTSARRADAPTSSSAQHPPTSAARRPATPLSCGRAAPKPTRSRWRSSATKPIYLPWDPGDITNAAAWLARNELERPVPAEQRRTTPLFVAGDAGTPLTHAVARAIFDTAKHLCFPPDVAKFLSLHSCRVWLACALLAAGKGDPTITACCRWLCPASVRTYAHMNPGDYRRHLQGAIAAPITSRLASTLASRITLGNGAAARAVSAEFGGDAAAAGTTDATAAADASAPTSPARAVPRGRRSASAPPSTAAADAALADTSANATMCTGR